MDINQHIKSDSDRSSNRRLKILILIACFIFIWIILIQFVPAILSSDIDKNWEAVSNDKIRQQKEIIIFHYNTYLSDISRLSERLSASADIQKLVQKSDSKKLFEELIQINPDDKYQIEIYNTRLELLAFKGRKLDSDIYTLQRALNGQKFTVLKEIGFYTFLLDYSPVYDNKETSKITGIILTSRLIDIKYQISNKFFQNSGLLYDIKSSLDFIPVIIPANVITGKINFDSASLSENVEVELNGIDGKVIGLLLFPKYSRMIHDKNISSLAVKIKSVLVFAFTVIIFLITLILLSKIHSPFIKFGLFVLMMTGIRYSWLEFHFPSKTIDLEIFSPLSYASLFGFGIAKSIGELLITSLFILAISVYGIILIRISRFQISSERNPPSGIISLPLNAVLVFLFFLMIFFYGSVSQSIIFDSNMKFFDKTNIVPSFEIFSIQLIILILSFSLFIFLSSIIILILKNSLQNFFREKSYRKYSFAVLLLILIFISEAIAPFVDNFKIDLINRLMIICFSFGLGLYFGIRFFITKNFRIFSAKNISVIILLCTIIIPGILLENITSQETKFVELIGKSISEKDDDKIKFLLMTELSNLSENKRIENDLRNKDKLNELAFSVWADSKFSEENFNTAFIILDTGKKILSDFIFNSQVLNSDSILKFANANLFRKKKNPAVVTDSLLNTDSLEQDEDILDEEDEFFSNTNSAGSDNFSATDNIIILDNKEDKYYLGIVPVEKADLKNTTFATNLGYLMIAVQYESKNLLFQSSIQLFKNYTKDNLFEKLISDPIITEYIGGEIISSNNKDLSKANTLSLDAFRESVKTKNEKNNWRYELINNEKYRTYYILASPSDGSIIERIYSISLKRNDFKLTTFFYLKFILFAVFVYLLTMLIMSSFLISMVKNFRMNFREKLFASFFIVSVIPIVLLAFYTRSFIKNKYDNNFQNQIISDLNLASQSVKGIQINLNSLDTLGKEKNKYLTKALSNTDKNFNLFLKTKLVSTTNEELYKSDLLDTRVDADAYYNIVYLRKDFFSKTEEIGVYSFIVGYKPFFDSKNNVIGLMSSQSVYRQNEFKEELTEILTFLFGIYLIVIIILLFFVIFITDRISKPILRLKYATERIAQGESYIELKNNRKDEIGNLVESFNKMTRELESSKEKLKKAEREAAWRDIARRVAHEIKNPLTPMKLSIEHLYDSYDKTNADKFSEVLKKTRNIIINEIDKLNKIATEFSNFAKLSGKNYEETDLNEIIGEVVSLYKPAPEIHFEEQYDLNICRIYADRQELNRVFQNIVKNSIQAITGQGIIRIRTFEKDNSIFAEISDNGCGIDSSLINNLFEPNFSTKSTGMGLGLSIVKKSLDDMKAEIIFQSDPGSGTKITIIFIPFTLNQISN